MRLYDEVIGDTLKLLRKFPGRKMDVNRQVVWQDAGRETMILRSDMAFELGGSNLPAMGSLMITADQKLVPENEIWLYGKDISELSFDTPYVRIAMVRVNEETMGEGDALYNQIRRLEYTKYHLYPEGFMLRIAASSEREMVRIGRKAWMKGISFEQIGKMFVRSYRKNPGVEAVKLVFLTLPDFPYEKIGKQIRKAEQITRAIDHILKDLTMDCQSCGLKEICDEVEGMRELHFGKK